MRVEGDGGCGGRDVGARSVDPDTCAPKGV